MCLRPSVLRCWGALLLCVPPFCDLFPRTYIRRRLIPYYDSGPLHKHQIYIGPIFHNNYYVFQPNRGRQIANTLLMFNWFRVWGRVRICYVRIVHSDVQPCCHMCGTIPSLAANSPYQIFVAATYHGRVQPIVSTTAALLHSPFAWYVLKTACLNALFVPILPI